MLIHSALVDILLELDFEKYGAFVVYENGQKVLYLVMRKALYGMIESSLLCYKKFRGDIEDIGYKVNPYNMCCQQDD